MSFDSALSGVVGQPPGDLPNLGNWTQVSRVAGGFFTDWTTREALLIRLCNFVMSFNNNNAQEKSYFYWKFVIFLVFCWILYSDWFYNSLMNKSLLLVPCYNKWGNGGWESLRVLPKTAQLTRAWALLSPPQGALSCLYWGAECLCHLLDFVPSAGDDFPHSWTSPNISVPCSCART